MRNETLRDGYRVSSNVLSQCLWESAAACMSPLHHLFISMYKTTAFKKQATEREKGEEDMMT